MIVYTNWKLRVRLEYNSMTQDTQSESGESVNFIEKTDLNLFSMIHLLRLKVHVSFLKLDSEAITRLASPHHYITAAEVGKL